MAQSGGVGQVCKCALEPLEMIRRKIKVFRGSWSGRALKAESVACFYLPDGGV